MNENLVLGVDVGGTGVKYGVVDVATGILIKERFRIATPEGAGINDIVGIVNEFVKREDWKGKVGIGFPASIKNGHVMTANNISNDWLNVNINERFSQATGLNCKVLNDADAAGIAELKFNGRDPSNLKTIFLTLGTGIGSAIFEGDQLVANTELGSLIMSNGLIAEKYAANSIRKSQDLSWSKWGKRVNEYINLLNSYFYPDQLIIGGGVSKKIEKYRKYLNPDLNIEAAVLQNEAGVIGAAMFAFDK